MKAKGIDMKIDKLLVMMIGMGLGSVHAQNISWQPTLPTRDDCIEIQISNSGNTGLVHWGINAKGSTWQPPEKIYWPKHSVADGVAVDSPFARLSPHHPSTLKLGPFNQTTQIIQSIDFAIKLDEDNWDNNEGRDYHILISQDRINVEPAGITLNDTITVTVKRSKPGGLLRWGVNAKHNQWLPPAEIYYPAGTLPSDDGLAVDSPLSYPDKNGLSTLQLGPFNQPEQVVTSLHMAVHWDADWDTDSGRNYNTTISLKDPSGSDILLKTPTSNATLTNSVFVSFANTTLTPATLWIDGKALLTLTKPPWEWNIDLPDYAYGSHILTIQQTGGEQVALDSLSFWRIPESQQQPMPTNLTEGASLTEDGKHSFVLYAPGKHVISLVGNFNDWDPAADPMHCDENGWWWLLKDLPKGRYQYQYLIDGEILVADPYSTDVDWIDEEGKETYQPELAKSVIDSTLPPYVWHDKDYQRPPLDQLVIYELFIEDFCPGEGFSGVTARLDYIKDMGFNAIEPLPVIECSGAGGWGYNPAYHMAPEGLYGTPDELRQLVDTAHQRGIAVIHDAVFNHMCASAPLYRMYGTDYENSPYFYLFTGENWGMPDIDQESVASKRYFEKVIRYWIKDYHIDGFRYDATRWVGWQGYNDWGASWFAYAGHMADTGSYHIAEHLPTDPDLMNNTEMDSGWHAHFRWRIRDMLVNGKIDKKEFHAIMNPLRAGFSNALQRMTYTESHDDARMMYDLQKNGWPIDEALTRSISAMVLTLTAPGVPMIYSGQEFGEDTKKFVGRNPLQWDYLDDPDYEPLHDAMSRLVHLRTSHPALRTGDIRIINLNEEQHVALYERYAKDGSVIVGCNFGSVAQSTSFTLPFHGTWTEVLSKKIIPANQTYISFDLAPGESRVLSGMKKGRRSRR